MSLFDTCVQDVLQVCRNGHVITDLLQTQPESGAAHCDRCGASTLDCCPTCGESLPGAIPVPGLVLVGQLPAPRYCSHCGAAFPWTERARPPEASAAGALERLLRRVPLVARQLRGRHGTRPAFGIDDVHDLEDLVRSLLPLHFDDVRPLGRTPRYAPDTRTDFLLPEQEVAVVVKRVTAEVRERQIAAQLEEDAAAHRTRVKCRKLVYFVYDPEGLLREPDQLERMWSEERGGLEVRCIIAG